MSTKSGKDILSNQYCMFRSAEFAGWRVTVLRGKCESDQFQFLCLFRWSNWSPRKTGKSLDKTGLVCSSHVPRNCPRNWSMISRKLSSQAFFIMDLSYARQFCFGCYTCNRNWSNWFLDFSEWPMCCASISQSSMLTVSLMHRWISMYQ